MRRLTVCVGAASADWAEQLRPLLPGFEIQAWNEGDAPADLALAWKAPAAFWEQQQRLQAIFSAGAGVDALLAQDLPPGVPLFRLEDAGMGAQMAEYVLHALLRWYRGFDRYAAQAAQGQWAPLPPPRKADWPVGLLGAGVLAQPVLTSLRALGFPVQAWARRAREGLLHGEAGLRQLLQGSRVVVALLPLTPATRHLLNAERLAWLPEGAYVINVARGGLIDEAALLAALDSGRLAGAALDVCETEPAGPEHPFWRHPRVQLTPHISAATLRDESLAQIARKVQAFVRGEAVSGRVGSAGY